MHSTLQDNNELVRENAELRAELDELRQLRGKERHLASRHLEELFALAESQRSRLSGVLERLPWGVMLVAADTGRLVGLNGAARELLALGPGRPADLKKAGLRCGLELTSLLEGLDHRRLELPGGRELRVQRVSADDGAVLLLFADHSEEAREERRHHDFISTVSHELRTPLTSMRTALELVVAGDAGELNDEQLRFLQMVLRNVERQGRLVEELLDLGRQEAGTFDLHPLEIDLAQLLRESVEGWSQRAREEGRDLRISLPVSLHASVDPDRIGQLLDNLLGNAFKFSAGDERIRLSLRAGEPAPSEEWSRLLLAAGLPPTGLLISVADEGDGMSSEEKERAFERFWQAGDPLAGRPDGAGLGLAICRSLVESHGGKIQLESQTGAGTTVSCWFPVGSTALRLLAALPRLQRGLDQAARRLLPTRLHVMKAESAHVDSLLARLGEREGAVWARPSAELLLWLGEGHIPAPPDDTIQYGVTDAPLEGMQAPVLLALALERCQTVAGAPSSATEAS